MLKVWRANGLKPHRVETFKVSRDPLFVEKLENIVGRYLSPPEHALVLCCDNYATHKHAKVKKWLAKHPRFHVHFTPTSASWLNRVERFFRSISTDRLEREVFRSVPELIAAIDEYIAAHNPLHLDRQGQ